MRASRLTLFALLLLGGAAVLASWFSGPADAAVMESVRDLISASAPGASSTHLLQFRASTSIPAGGRIVVFFPEGFDVPAGMGVEDVDFATSSAMNGTFVNRSLDSAPDGDSDGVSFATGTSGRLTLTLNSSQGISAGTHMKITLGTNATFEGAGDTDILNSTTTGSHRVSFETRNAGGSLLDFASTYVVVIAPVAMITDTKDFDAPIISNALPSGTIPAGIRNVEISFNTDEPATCRYATNPGLTYAQMPNPFPMTLDTFHYTVVTTPSDNATYHFYIICRDFVPNYSDTYDLSFTVAAPLPPPSAPGGGGMPYPAPPPVPQITLSGRTFPTAAVTILKDNLPFQQVTASSDGSFQMNQGELPQGTHTFSIYARDSAGTRTSSYSTTLTVIQGTRNVVSGILLSPTVRLEKTNLGAAEPANLSGSSVPGSRVEIQIIPQQRGVSASQIVRQTVTAGQSGAWSLTVNTASMPVGGYEVRVRAVDDFLGTSLYGQSAYFGIGRPASADSCGRSDLNGDGKVNLVDFSILLFHWNSANPLADINLDGKVNLVDFSVMLFCWTG